MQKLRLLVLLAMLVTVPAVGSEAPLSYVGHVKTLWKVYRYIVGWTTVTPGYELAYYYNAYFGTYSAVNFSDKQVMRVDSIGTRFYEKWHLESSGKWTVTKDVFPIIDLERKAKKCVPSTGFEYNTLTDFTMNVWVISADKHGLLAPKAPYKGWLKSTATRVSETCDTVVPFVTGAYASASLPEHGKTPTKFPFIGFHYAGPPMTCWVGEMIDY